MNDSIRQALRRNRELFREQLETETVLPPQEALGETGDLMLKSSRISAIEAPGKNEANRVVLMEENSVPVEKRSWSLTRPPEAGFQDWKPATEEQVIPKIQEVPTQVHFPQGEGKERAGTEEDSLEILRQQLETEARLHSQLWGEEDEQ